MKATTLFEAYVKCAERREAIRGHRGFDFGIAVDTDHKAIQWQRRNRQCQKLQERLRNIMMQVGVLNERQAP